MHNSPNCSKDSGRDTMTRDICSVSSKIPAEKQRTSQKIINASPSSSHSVSKPRKSFELSKVDHQNSDYSQRPKARKTLNKFQDKYQFSDGSQRIVLASENPYQSSQRLHNYQSKKQRTFSPNLNDYTRSDYGNVRLMMQRTRGLTDQHSTQRHVTNESRSSSLNLNGNNRSDDSGRSTIPSDSFVTDDLS